jgi:hypothetical protein
LSGTVPAENGKLGSVWIVFFYKKLVSKIKHGAVFGDQFVKTDFSTFRNSE